jgi:itaconyl-CoA hydratase
VSTSAELGAVGFFEDFAVGDRMRHARGKTITEADMSLMTLLVMNTAQGHFNEHRQERRQFGTRINFGGLTLSLVIGLATQDTASQSISEVGLDAVRLREPVMPGDTIYAATEVIDKRAVERADAGEVVFRHWGFNQYDAIVCTAERTVLLHRREWSTK